MKTPSYHPPMPPPNRLATYGTLGPGRPNHQQLAPLGGRWTTGVVHGRLVARGWGAAQGFPGLVLDPVGAAVAVDVLEADALAGHWDRLDGFEGPEYKRVVTAVQTPDGLVEAFIYVLAAGE